MKRPFVVLLAVAAAVAWLDSSAQAYPYKWMDEQGTVHYSQFPPKTPAKPAAASARAGARQPAPGAVWDTAAHARWETYMDAGMKAFDEGRYPEAEKPLEAAVREADRFGPQDRRLGASLGLLAKIYERQGQYAKAEPLFRRAIAALETAVGPESATQERVNLIQLYLDQGKYAQAEPLLRRALAIQEKTLGPEHPNVAGTLDSLATVYRDQGKYAEAEPLYKRALAIYGKTLGPEHPNVAVSLGRYAVLLRKAQRDAEAATAEAQARAILAKTAPGN